MPKRYFLKSSRPAAHATRATKAAFSSRSTGTDRRLKSRRRKFSTRKRLTTDDSDSTDKCACFIRVICEIRGPKMNPQILKPTREEFRAFSKYGNMIAVTTELI